MKKKICILRAGDVTYISRIHKTALALQETGIYNVTVISITPRENKKRENYIYGMMYIDIRSRFFKSSFFSFLRIIEGLTKLFFKTFLQRADIYIAIGIEDLIICYIISKLTRAKFIYSANELEGDRKRIGNEKLNSILNDIIIIVERWILKSAESVIAADYERAKLMENWYKLNKVEVIRNVPLFKEILKKDLIREKLKIAKEEKILLYQGLINYGRGIEATIEACSKVQSENFCLVLLGFTTLNYKERLIDLAKKHDFKRLYIIPAVPWQELLFWTKSADVSIVLIENVSISYYLAAPNKIYESIMVGIPYIGSDFPEINHVHNIAKSGILVNPENITGIAKAIDRLIENKSFYNECIENALLARNILNWDREKEKLLDIMKEINLA